MNDLSPRPSGRMPRRQRERRAYQLTLATGAAALATVVVAVLALLDVTSFGLAFVLALITVALGFVLRRTLGR